VKNLTWQNPEQLFVAQELINKVKSKCCGIKVIKEIRRSYDDNDLCQITFLIGETRYMKNCIPVTTYNSKLWNPDKELFIFDNMHKFPSNFRK